MNIYRPYSEQFDSNFIWRLLFVLCSVALIIAASDAAADDADVVDPVGKVLCNVILAFSGNTARGIAIVSMIVLGIQTLRGQLKWEIALIIVTGIIILFKAPDIIKIIASSAGGDATCATENIT
ncbi:TrbC/VirB2 family protein [Candidatus Tisiphia endosymbiont of Oplodontha viridula]|uniref:TrbC/VirB2 family protein n=1 Tax=Candidatus Tisiphia endosymbiont of Oplodontha viridula TaxID=3077925 RepID=UPI0035C8909D